MSPFSCNTFTDLQNQLCAWGQLRCGCATSGQSAWTSCTMIHHRGPWAHWLGHPDGAYVARLATTMPACALPDRGCDSTPAKLQSAGAAASAVGASVLPSKPPHRKGFGEVVCPSIQTLWTWPPASTQTGPVAAEAPSASRRSPARATEAATAAFAAGAESLR